MTINDIKVLITELDKSIIKNILKRIELCLNLAQIKNDSGECVEDKLNENGVFDIITNVTDKNALNKKDIHSYIYLLYKIYEFILEATKKQQQKLYGKN